MERHPYSGLVLYEISGDDLDQLENEGLAVGEDFSFALFGISVAVSFTITLLSTKIESDRLYQSFFVVTLLGYLAGAFFGIRWINARRKHAGIVKKIKARVGPLGDDTRTVQPGELANVPTESSQGQGGAG